MDVEDLIARAGGVGQFADTLGVSHSTICDWKRVKHIPGNRVTQIAEALGLTTETVVKLVRGPSTRARRSAPDAITQVSA